MLPIRSHFPTFWVLNFYGPVGNFCCHQRASLGFIPSLLHSVNRVKELKAKFLSHLMIFSLRIRDSKTVCCCSPSLNEIPERQQHSVNQKPHHWCFWKCPRSQPRPPPCMASWSLYAKSKRGLFNLPFEKFLHVPKLQSDFCKEKIIESAGDQSLVYMAGQVQQNKRVPAYTPQALSLQGAHSQYFIQGKYNS